MRISKFALLTTSSLLAFSGGAYAASQQAAGESLEEVVVTGSRIERAGYEAPTPVTMANRDEIQAAATPDLGEYLTKLPAFGVGVTTANTNHSMSGGQAGISLVNLRNLGITSTLVLFDGRRVANSTLVGGVDMGLIPDTVVQRIDIVTGGASAAWGSDAVAGVVNIITNKEFEGIESRVEAGIGNYGTNFTHKEDITYGRSFADGRGHFVASFAYTNTPVYTYPNEFPWFQSNCLFPNSNTAAGQPRLEFVRNCYQSAGATRGGLITAGPLKNTMFLPGGVSAPYVVDRAAGTWVAGRDADQAHNPIFSLNAPTKRYNFYNHNSFAINDNLNVNLDLNFSDVHSRFQTTFHRVNNMTIKADNAYIPASIRAAMTANGLTQFQMSRINMDFDDGLEQYSSGEEGVGRVQPHVTRQMYRAVLGLDGKITDNWSWNAYYQRGQTRNRNKAFVNPYVPHYNLAVDAVVNPANGQIVCRSTLTNPTNGCVPMNLFGFGSPSKESIDYVINTFQGVQGIYTTQDVAAATITGSPFNAPAGPVDVATGFEWRRETARATADAESEARRFFSGNYGKLNKVAITVKEAFGEMNIPIFKDQSFARSLDINAAVRVTDYSTSGVVVTWKGGVTWQVNDEIRLRATRSRDIRQPTMSELFTPGLLNTVTIADLQKGNSTVQAFQVSGGNPNLSPEKGDTWTGGGVYSPAWLDGLQMSVDYYTVGVTGAIVLPTALVVQQQCLAGVQLYCALIGRLPPSAGATLGDIETVTLIPVNAAEQRVAGIDVEASYRLGIGPGEATFRVIGNYNIEQSRLLDGIYSNNVGSFTANTPGGQAGLPRLKLTANARYNLDPFTIGLEMQMYGSGKLNTYWTDADIRAEDNKVPAVFFFNLQASYDFEVLGGNLNAYMNIQNVLDRGPPQLPVLYNGAAGAPLWDPYGRVFRGGIRAKF